MQYSTLLVPLALTFVAAQYGNAPPSKTSAVSSSGSSGASSKSTGTPSTFTSTSGVVTHLVAVGINGEIGFTPNAISAKVGEAIEFHFYPPSHSVNQATFDKPCEPANGTGFASGNMVTSSGMNANVFTITINDTSPIYFYCGAPTHCQNGMTGAINAP